MPGTRPSLRPTRQRRTSHHRRSTLQRQPSVAWSLRNAGYETTRLSQLSIPTRQTLRIGISSGRARISGLETQDKGHHRPLRPQRATTCSQNNSSSGLNDHTLQGLSSGRKHLHREVHLQYIPATTSVSIAARNLAG
jgi:hypothetical protein